MNKSKDLNELQRKFKTSVSQWVVLPGGLQINPIIANNFAVAVVPDLIRALRLRD